jgi:hypothetical protein
MVEGQNYRNDSHDIADKPSIGSGASLVQSNTGKLQERVRQYTEKPRKTSV